MNSYIHRYSVVLNCIRKYKQNVLELLKEMQLSQPEFSLDLSISIININFWACQQIYHCWNFIFHRFWSYRFLDKTFVNHFTDVEFLNERYETVVIVKTKQFILKSDTKYVIWSTIHFHYSRMEAII